MLVIKTTVAPVVDSDRLYSEVQNHVNHGTVSRVAAVTSALTLGSAGNTLYITLYGHMSSDMPGLL